MRSTTVTLHVSTRNGAESACARTVSYVAPSSAQQVGVQHDQRIGWPAFAHRLPCLCAQALENAMHMALLMIIAAISSSWHVAPQVVITGGAFVLCTQRSLLVEVPCNMFLPIAHGNGLCTPHLVRGRGWWTVHYNIRSLQSKIASRCFVVYMVLRAALHYTLAALHYPVGDRTHHQGAQVSALEVCRLWLALRSRTWLWWLGFINISC